MTGFSPYERAHVSGPGVAVKISHEGNAPGRRKDSCERWRVLVEAPILFEG